MDNPKLPVCVAALYRFARLTNDRDGLAALRQRLSRLCSDHGIKGTLLLAREGINGTIAGTDRAVALILDEIRQWPGCGDLQPKYARAATTPFHRMKVRLKREIVTMGQPDIDPLTSAGTYVTPQDWNALIAAPGTIVIDTRNDYEVEIGSFAGAIDPHIGTFRDFPAWLRSERARFSGTPKIAMFCTGGIRCEKATAFLKAEGLDEVYHLQGGILAYLETVPPADSLWQGECFVFDARVSVGPGLAPGTHTLCHACRRPVNASGRASALFEEGVSCPACRPERNDTQRAGYRERQRQEALAKRNGHAHVGGWGAVGTQAQHGPKPDLTYTNGRNQ